jgi:hypothetical protein
MVGFHERYHIWWIPIMVVIINLFGIPISFNYFLEDTNIIVKVQPHFPANDEN